MKIDIIGAEIEGLATAIALELNEIKTRLFKKNNLNHKILLKFQV